MMVVDDSPLMGLVVRNLFSDDPNVQIAGYAKNGKEALDKLDELKPDLILLDIEMPVMDGFEFLPRAKLKSRAKVLILSSIATAGSEVAAKARKLGADAVINKPSGAVSLDLKAKTGSELFQVVYKLLNIST